ncbi:MAG: PqqD family peptide modification chaperone [Rhizobiales bacterium]|nr:PqqD family peptide modification chaperone [Hyphomicrobiales bacterium]
MISVPTSDHGGATEGVLKGTDHRVLAPAAGVFIEVIEGECLACHPEHTRAFYLNPSAALIWGLCDGIRSTDVICQMIQQGYPEAPTSLCDDVGETLVRLEECGLLVAK